LSVLLSEDSTGQYLQEPLSLVRPVISFVLPIHNGGWFAAPKIAHWVESANHNLPKFEIVIVDDGSTDDTSGALEALKISQLKVVRTKENLGKGAALEFGFGFVTGDIVIFADGDLQALPINFFDFIDTLKESSVAIASKRVPGSVVEAGTTRIFLSVAFNCVVRLLLSLPLADTQAGFKVFRRTALQRIIPLLSVKRYAFDAELLTVANLLGMKIVEIPAFVKLESRFRSGNIMRMFVDVLGIAFRLRIRRWYQRNLDGRNGKYKPFLNWK
jgi:dolichyl-phosphate beta-glucosyltransferase